MSLALPDEVFLSHSNHDRDFVDSLANVMRRHGVPVWYSQTNIMGAQQWHDEIGAALRRCDWFVIILSPQSVESEWVKHELMYVFRHNRLRNRIVPVLHQKCDPEQLSWMLPEFQMIDFTSNFADGCRSLFRVWGLGYMDS
jgi:hypothetical protein